MNENEESKAAGRNFKFLKSADAELERQSKGSGKTMTAVLEDLLLGRRQFRPEIERFISEQMEKHQKPRSEIIEAALYSAMKLAEGVMPKSEEFRPTISKTEKEIKSLGVSKVSSAIHLSRESEKKQKAESPSENKASRATNAHGRPKK